MRFQVDQQYEVNGSDIHHGHVVTIVDPQAEIRKHSEKDLNGNFALRRPGLVAAHDPAYKSTLWWWFAPHQLKEIKTP